MNDVGVVGVLALLAGALVAWLVTKLALAQKVLQAQSAQAVAVAQYEAQLQQARLSIGEHMAQYNELQANHHDLQQSHQEALAQQARLNVLLSQTRVQHEEKVALLIEAKEALGHQFKVLAADILAEQSKQFSAQNQQSMATILTPIHTKMTDFSTLVQNTYEKEAKERLTLENELKRLQVLNSQLNQDAVALTRALTGQNHKTQGNWGEMVLSRILESSGLTLGREYQTQSSGVVEDDSGSLRRMQPDVVIYLPENKHIVIDAKVSLNAYLRYTRAEDDAERAQALKEHVAAVRQHVESLSKKTYQDIKELNSLDFVFMFMPVEPAYMLALQHDDGLFEACFEKRIMIVGPSTLLATLRTVSSLWRTEQQNQNALNIAAQGGKLYDKFVGLVLTLEKLGKQMGTAQDSYEQVMRQLQTGRGNLIGQAEKLQALGVAANKRLPDYYRQDDDADELDGTDTD
ncbi:MAG: DNA recombination protein RmuC [Neisseriaceae bacterium]|nr:DNA recombination protein RmuC [Neisseriaceae bacterium]MBP6861939.1 DNA recombination protein RmuC [Neisseriaceae bacterium]